LLNKHTKTGDELVNIREELQREFPAAPAIQLNDVDVDPASIRAIMINEVVPGDPAQDFYGSSGEEYLSTAIPLFQRAGLQVQSIEDILAMGVYITNAVKMPKTAYAIEKSSMEESLPWLEKEISLFPNVQVILLMGDVAKKMYNQIARKTNRKNVIPSGATYKLRSEFFFHGHIRVMPSYIITGGNILIEKSKAAMVAEDIAVMAKIIGK
jgi:uracil-DNA glycosylase